MRTNLKAAALMLLVLAPRSAAQLQAGLFKFNLNGLVSAGYTGTYGNLTGSDHGITLGGSGTMTGSFYSPNFLSFNIQPYLNQSRENSSFQSISDTSGVNASTSIFSGSNFPGSVSYSKSFNSQGNFAVPGVADFTSHGQSQVFSVGWSENVPKLPNVSVSFQDGTNAYSLYGTDGNIASAYRTLGAQATYSILGFNMNGGYHYTQTDSEIPSVFGASPESSTSDTSSYSFGLGHRLPLNGSFSAGASRSQIESDGPAGPFNATLDTVNSGVSFSPLDNFHFGANLQYTDNLAAQLEQTIVAAGGGIEGGPQQSSHALAITAYASYAIPTLHLTFNGTDDRRAQNFLGQSYQSDAYTGSATYSNEILGGFLNATAGVTRNRLYGSGQITLGLLGSFNYSREHRGWTFSGTGNYSQNTQTVLIAYTNSGYGYSMNAGRKFGKHGHWASSASGSRTTLNGLSDGGSFSQSYSTVVAIRWIGLSGAYSRSSGNSILTSTGLQPITVPLPVVTPSAVVLYGGKAYSGGIGLTPIRGLTVSLAYSQAYSNTQGDVLTTNNKTSQLNTFLQYQMRKIYITAGFSRLSQSFSAGGTVPGVVASYYFGISRWFSFF